MFEGDDPMNFDFLSAILNTPSPVRHLKFGGFSTDIIQIIRQWMASDFGTIILSRLTAARASYLDNLNNSDLLNLPNLSTLSGTMLTNLVNLFLETQKIGDFDTFLSLLHTSTSNAVLKRLIESFVKSWFAADFKLFTVEEG